MKTIYKNDPTDDYEEVKELTAEDVYYSFEGQTPEEASQYITHLERTLREVKNDLEHLIIGCETILPETAKQLKTIKNKLR